MHLRNYNAKYSILLHFTTVNNPFVYSWIQIWIFHNSKRLQNPDRGRTVMKPRLKRWRRLSWEFWWLLLVVLGFFVFLFCRLNPHSEFQNQETFLPGKWSEVSSALWTWDFLILLALATVEGNPTAHSAQHAPLCTMQSCTFLWPADSTMQCFWLYVKKETKPKHCTHTYTHTPLDACLL